MIYLYGGRFLRSVTQGYLGIVVPLYLLSLGYPASRIGFLLAVAVGGSAALTLLVGVLADRIGRKPILVAFALFTALAGAIFALHAPFAVLALAAAFGTIGQGGGAASGGAFGPYYPAEQALIAELAGDARRTLAFSRLSIFGAIGGTIGAAMASIHPELLFTLTIALGVAMAVVVLPVPERRVFRQHTEKLAPLTGETRSLVLRFMVTNATNGLAIGFLGPVLVLWFHLHYNASAHEIALLYGTINAVSLLSYFGAERVVRALGGAVRTVVGIRIVSCVLLAAMPLAPTFTLAGAIYLVRMLFNLLTMPVRQSYVMGVIPAHERSRAAAASNLPSRGAAMAGPATAGWLFEHAWMGLPLEIAALFQLVNAALYWTFFRNVLPPEEEIAPTALSIEA